MDGIQNLHRQEDNNLAELTTILDSGDIKTLQLGPSTQAHKAGQIFYDDDTKTVSIHNEVPGVTLNVGRRLIYQYTMLQVLLYLMAVLLSMALQ